MGKNKQGAADRTRVSLLGGPPPLNHFHHLSVMEASARMLSQFGHILAVDHQLYVLFCGCESNQITGGGVMLRMLATWGGDASDLCGLGVQVRHLFNCLFLGDCRSACHRGARCSPYSTFITQVELYFRECFGSVRDCDRLSHLLFCLASSFARGWRTSI